MGVTLSTEENKIQTDIEDYIIDLKPLLQLKHELSVRLNFRQNVKAGRELGMEGESKSELIDNPNYNYESPLKNALQEEEEANSDSSNSLAEVYTMANLQEQYKALSS